MDRLLFCHVSFYFSFFFCYLYKLVSDRPYKTLPLTRKWQPILPRNTLCIMISRSNSVATSVQNETTPTKARLANRIPAMWLAMTFDLYTARMRQRLPTMSMAPRRAYMMTVCQLISRKDLPACSYAMHTGCILVLLLLGNIWNNKLIWLHNLLLWLQLITRKDFPTCSYVMHTGCILVLLLLGNIWNTIISKG